jgi:hypothetical protein
MTEPPYKDPNEIARVAYETLTRLKIPFVLIWTGNKANMIETNLTPSSAGKALKEMQVLITRLYSEKDLLMMDTSQMLTWRESDLEGNCGFQMGPPDKP